MRSKKLSFIALSWTIVHPINEESPLRNLVENDVEELEAEFMISIKAIDDTYSQQIFDRNSYFWKEMKWDAKFLPMVSKSETGKTIIDLKKYLKLKILKSNMYKIFLILFFTCIAGTSWSQVGKSELQKFQQGEKLQQEEKWSEALVVFKELLKRDSSNVEYLWRTSFMYCIIGFEQKTESSKQEWYEKATYLGKKAITQHPQNANAHYAYAVSLGRMTEFGSNKIKIENAKLIKSEAELTLKLDPKTAGAYHILGRWHREIASFNFFERTMITAIFGALPGGTHDESIKNFEKAILLEPMNSIHYFELAQSYLARDEESDKQNAKNWLIKATQIQVKSIDDKNNKSKCEKLLKEI